MKNLIAISLVVLILFNILGVYGLLQGLRIKFRQDLVQRLDNEEYLQDETITIKVPLSIPYYMDDEGFSRVDGEIEHQGEFYRLVKQKLSKDTLYIICIKDKKSTQIKKALADYVRTFADKPFDGKSNGKTNLITFLKDYIPCSFSISREHAGWTNTIAPYFSCAFIKGRAIAVSSPPPKA